MDECWLPVVGYEGKYDVSDLGRVRRGSHILRGRINTRGYHQLRLYGEGGGKSHRVHRLVAEAFLGPRPAGHETNHINGVKTDNRATNLEWVTPSQNALHANANGFRSYAGTRNGQAKLTDQAVREIRGLAGQFTRAEIGRRFGICESAASRIINRRRWPHV